VAVEFDERGGAGQTAGTCNSPVPAICRMKSYFYRFGCPPPRPPWPWGGTGGLARRARCRRPTRSAPPCGSRPEEPAGIGVGCRACGRYPLLLPRSSRPGGVKHAKRGQHHRFRHVGRAERCVQLHGPRFGWSAAAISPSVQTRVARASHCEQRRSLGSQSVLQRPWPPPGRRFSPTAAAAAQPTSTSLSSISLIRASKALGVLAHGNRVDHALELLAF